MSEPDLHPAYSDSLWTYVATGSDEALARARELGKASLQAGQDSSYVAMAHFKALQAGSPPQGVSAELSSERASRFLIEALGPFSTARHRLEEMSRELAEMNDTLIDRTRELETANDELETFSYSISHDLRTSLQAVLGFAQTLTVRHSQSLDAEASRCVEMIIKGARGMNELVDDLLALAQANRLPLNLESVDLDLLAREHVHATFFVIGQNAERHPDLIHRMFDEGHEIGNHTFTRPNLAAVRPEPPAAFSALTMTR